MTPRQRAATSPFSGLYGLPTGLGSNTNIYNNRSLTKLSYKADGEAEYSLHEIGTLDGWLRLGEN